MLIKAKLTDRVLFFLLTICLMFTVLPLTALANSYTITFNSKGGSKISSLKGKYDSAIPLPSKKPTKKNLYLPDGISIAPTPYLQRASWYMST